MKVQRWIEIKEPLDFRASRRLGLDLVASLSEFLHDGELKECLEDDLTNRLLVLSTKIMSNNPYPLITRAIK